MDHYRVPFFDRLRGELGERGIALAVVYGRTKATGAERSVPAELPWGIRVESRVIRMGSRHVHWQPCLAMARTADLVIVEQATKRLLNYVLLARQLGGKGAVAFWGHGRNFQTGSASTIGEAVKRFISRFPHWWFAYNDLSAEIVRELGYPERRITTVYNAIDTRSLVEGQRVLDPVVVNRVKQKLGLAGRHVGLWYGGIYPEKRPEFGIEAALAVRALVPDFELLVIGDGANASIVAEAAEQHAWLHCLGPVFDEEKLPYFELAKVAFLPGLVGLGVLDSFALGVPIVASASAEHSPEIGYLEHDVNGLLVDDEGSPRLYAEAVAKLLIDDSRRDRLRRGCAAIKDLYNVEDMARNVAEGVDAALGASQRTLLDQLKKG